MAESAEGSVQKPAPQRAPRAMPEQKSAALVWQVGGERIDYVATAGHVAVTDAERALAGHMFYVSYAATQVNGAAVGARSRPVTFCYNGGPGSSSVPINFGGLGPRRVATQGCGFVGAGATVQDNPGTLLRQSDLVFLDALGTGWSLVAEGYDATAVYGVDGDARAFCSAICEWLERNNRWGSPVYLYGESYGTARNAVLMRYLGEAGVVLSGVIMLSAIFDWAQTLPGCDLYYVGLLPSFAATAQFFGLVGQGVDEDAWFDQASLFARDVYAPALFKGDALGADGLRELAEQVAALTGLPAAFVLARNCRLELEDFRREALAARGKMVGRLDMRFAEPALLSVQGSSEFFACEDPAADAVENAWYMAFRDFVRCELGYEGPGAYKLSAYAEVGAHWNWMHEAPGTDAGAVTSPNLALDIAVALRRSPTTKLAILGGRYDAATPWWNMEHTLAQLFLPCEIKQQIVFKRYGCGHFAYVDEPTLMQMARDMEGFYSVQ